MKSCWSCRRTKFGSWILAPGFLMTSSVPHGHFMYMHKLSHKYTIYNYVQICLNKEIFIWLWTCPLHFPVTLQGSAELFICFLLAQFCDLQLEGQWLQMLLVPFTAWLLLKNWDNFHAYIARWFHMHKSFLLQTYFSYLFLIFLDTLIWTLGSVQMHVCITFHLKIKWKL